ncbi:AP endonuclease 1 [Gracilaria domingensis]|nr:AP endonuclease 1 [Gracilaria domingensis]
MRPLGPLFETLDSDIICLQETKMSGRGDPELESVAFVKGYDSFFSICNQKRGYSGVATFCRKKVATPYDAGEGFCDGVGGASIEMSESEAAATSEKLVFIDEEEAIPRFSSETLEIVKDEGRCVITDHGCFVLINVYVPAVTVMGRAMFKMQFLDALRAKVCALQGIGRKVIVVGDLNICPSLKDRAEPVLPSELYEWNRSPTRLWLRAFLERNNMVDSFRELHPDTNSAYTCWSEATRSRENNHGVRIDLILVSRDFFTSSVTEATVWSHIKGSDHCPVSIRLQKTSDMVICAKRLPSFCTQNMRRFGFRQQPLTSLLVKREKPGSPSPEPCTRLTGKIRKLSKGSVVPVVPSARRFGQGEKKGNEFARERERKRKGRYTQTSLLALTQRTHPLRRSSCEENLSSIHQNSTKTPVSASDGGECLQDGTEAGFHNTATSDHQERDLLNKHKRKVVSQAWRKLLTGPPPTPRCRHGELCALKKVTKSGENRGRTFFSCPYPAGIGKTANCNFFQWAPFRAGFEPT